MLAYDRTLRSKDADGRLHVALCNISKATVNPYCGREIPGWQGLGLHPDRIYSLYRDPKELAAGAHTFERIPLLLKHIPTNAEHPEKEHWVGTTGGPVVYEHPYLKAPLSVWDGEAITDIETREREQLSSSYRYVPDMTAGISPEGLRYDGVMRNIVGNHVALVPAGRAGPDVVVADEQPQRFFKMRRFLAALLPHLGVSAEQKVALDEALAMDAHGLTADEMKAACDGMAKELNKACDALSDEEREEAYKRAAKDKGKANDSAVPAATGITQEQFDAAVAAARAEGIEAGKAEVKAAHDAALAAAQADAEAKAAADKALADARAEVASVVGEVACDSADAVYAFALKQMKIDVDGVHTSAYPAMFRVAAAKTAAPPTMDAKPIDVATVFPQTANIRTGV